jgi:hypothetical protein
MAKRTAYTNAIILDGTRDMKPLEGHVLITCDDRIEAIVDASDNVRPFGLCEVIDLHGCYLMLVSSTFTYT